MSQGPGEHRPLLWRQLRSQVEDVIATIDGVVGVAIRDLVSGEETLLQPDLSFPTASAIKIPVLIALFKRAAEGQCSLLERRDILNEDQVQSPVLQFFGDGTSSLSLRDLAILMIRHSDNIATNILIDVVGADSVNALLDEQGLPQIRLRRKMLDQAASREGNENVATPRAALHLLERLHAGAVVSESLCNDVLTVMKLPKAFCPMTLALPSGVEIANKGGTLDGVRNGWAIIRPRARPFAIVFAANYLAKDCGSEVGQITRLAYDHFERIGAMTDHGVRLP